MPKSRQSVKAKPEQPLEAFLKHPGHPFWRAKRGSRVMELTIRAADGAMAVRVAHNFLGILKDYKLGCELHLEEREVVVKLPKPHHAEHEARVRRAAIELCGAYELLRASPEEELPTGTDVEDPDRPRREKASQAGAVEVSRVEQQQAQLQEGQP